MEQANSRRSSAARSSVSALDQVFQHGPQASGDLNARTAEMADLGDGQMDEVFPVRRPVHEPEPARRISHPPSCQMPIADRAQQVMDLVDGQDRGGRVVDPW